MSSVILWLFKITILSSYYILIFRNATIYRRSLRLRLHVVRTQRISTKSSHDRVSVYTDLLGSGPFWVRLADPSGHDSHNIQ